MLRGVDRGQHLIGGAARIRLAVRHAREIGRQLGSEPRAKNGDDDVALRRLRNLRLECRVRFVELGLPADRAEPGHPLKLAVEALDHALQAAALETRVAGRRHEDADLTRALRHGRRPSSPVPYSTMTREQ